MQRIIQNTFSITAYLGSNTYINTLVVDNGKLHQFYDKDGNGGAGSASPDWTVASNQPKFHFECRTTDGTVQTIQKNENLKLYYNETAITFSGNVSTGEPYAGMFKYEDIGDVRYYTICKNVAGVSNMDNDTLRIEGQILTEGNNLETVSTPMATIHVIPVASGGSAYFMEIDAPAIQKGADSTTIKAMLYKSDGKGEITSGVSWSWKRLDGDTYTQVGTAQTLTVPAADVMGFEHYTCTATIGGVTIIGACSVFDYNDGIFIGIEITGIGNPQSMRSAETATIKATVMDSKGSEIDSSKYTGTLQFTLLDKSGKSKATLYTNPISLTHSEIVSTYGGTVTGYVTLEQKKE